MRRVSIILIFTVMACLFPAACSAYTLEKGGVIYTYSSPTLQITMHRWVLNSQVCHVIDIALEDPARQIKKAASPWHASLADVVTLANQTPGVILAVNGSGYVSPRYPDIPETYPGESSDYWYEPLGSLTVIGGEVKRCLEGVPFYGLTLEGDGLHLYTGEDPRAVLEKQPLETWSFYDGCSLIRDGRILLDTQWDFAAKRARRNVIAEKKDGHILLFMVMDRPGVKLTDLTQCLLDHFDLTWAYNLDGGPSAALVRLKGSALRLIAGGDQQVVDIIGFTE